MDPRTDQPGDLVTGGATSLGSGASAAGFETPLLVEDTSGGGSPSGESQPSGQGEGGGGVAGKVSDLADKTGVAGLVEKTGAADIAGKVGEKVSGAASGGFDVKAQITQRPMVALGVGLLGGFLLGGRRGSGGGSQGSGRGGNSGGGSRHSASAYASQDRPPYVEGSATAYKSSQGMSGGLQGGLASAMKQSGLDETLNKAVGSLFATVNDRARTSIGQSLPGFEERLTARQADGGKSGGGKSGGGSGGQGTA
ncbi:MAG: hypothetical protein AVDCRST_MAG49-3193 [uncultured Thermomicrobiales bacterium]|uniref:Uncharacterized protein n=1 Tax=uncultured Thermomicrobiales bacterium TaxID=1645740 RepID=A0A6J4V2X7_9BACT|nr:MAG: hypothetical protein AVDCRST_MAG49-3193 [uncultured Thermomicrobiales bacterium]